MSAVLIAVENVHYIYSPATRGAVEALRGVTLDVLQGEYLAIIGHNGSGKSTLAKCLNGLLLPSEGTVRVNGLDTADPQARYLIRATVGMVFQNPDNQFVASTVAEEVAFGPENLRVPAHELRQRVHQALEQTELLGAAQRNPSHLSAGEKSRLAVAAMLAMQPTCLVLDESTAMLAPGARRQLLELLAQLHRQGLTIIVITHYMDEAALAQRLLVLDRGAIACQGSPQAVFADPRLDAIGLGLPPAAAIARGLTARGLPLSRDVLTPEELVGNVAALYGGRP
jgi:energy-coupling factor transport system ATP-binding protein